MKKLFTLIISCITLTVVFSQNNPVKVKSADEAKAKMNQATKVATPVTATGGANTTPIPTNSVPKAAPAPLPKTPAPVAAENPNAAEFKFNEESHDFGTVPEGPEVKYDFEFTNIGKEPLVLQNVRASCGCTTPVWSKEPIMPGQKSKITAVYHTQGRPGNFSKTITVTSNAKGGDKLLYIKGVVEKAPSTVAPEKAPNLINEIQEHKN